jgi:hypothetical protein
LISNILLKLADSLEHPYNETIEHVRGQDVTYADETGWRRGNRRFMVGGVEHKLGKYGRNVLRNKGQWHNITGLRETKAYQMAERIGQLNKLGTVKVVFSRRRGESKHIALVTDDLHASMRTVVVH